jgi:aspartate racemase
MKTLGLLGGTTWVSTIEYYRQINEGVNQKLGKLNFARCVLYSINMEEVMALREKTDQTDLINFVLDAVASIDRAGVDGLVLCANTLHLAAEEIQKVFDMPIIHIAVATAEKIREKGFSKVGLLGTRQTMEQDFYTSVLEQFGIETLIPPLEDRKKIGRIIFEELALDKFLEPTRQYFLKVMNELVTQGAEAIVLGCTEIPLLVKPEHTDIPLFDTLEIHTQAAVDFAIS